MNRVALLLIAIFVFHVQGIAQLAVQSFRLLENDLTAQVTHPKTDQNGQKAALIKVVTTQTGFEFDGGMLGIVAMEQHTAEVWVYVPGRSKALTIKHPQLGVLRQYAYPIPVEAARTYELVLVSGTVETVVRPPEVPTQWLIIDTRPSDAEVYINDQPAGHTPYQVELPVGRYTFRLNKELYLPDGGVVELTADGGRKTISVSLKPNFGSLQLTSEPEGGARVMLNGIDMGKNTPCTLERVPAGEHTLTLTHQWYTTTTQRFSMAPGQSLPLRVTMQPIFAEVQVKTMPEAEIIVNGVLRGKGSWVDRLTPAVYTFEARLQNHRTATERQAVVSGQHLELALTPQPITGSLRVMTTPYDVLITLNGKEYGLSPITIRDLMVGNYTLTLSKQGYGTVTKSITVAEGKITEVTETLPTGMAVTIASDPAGAQLSIDGTPAGSTPYVGTLAYGPHTLKLVNGRKEVTESITVAQGGTARWQFNVAELASFTEHVAGIGIEMVAVQGGTFTMGCTGEQEDCYNYEKPTFQVTLSDYYIGKFEVTQAQWQAVMGSKPSHFKDCSSCPVEQVSWYDVQEFIEKLNKLTGKRFRLPTEAEWEYAARGGSSSKGYLYAGGSNIDGVAWFEDNSNGKTHPVGGKKPNELGLYDMSGNVWEWCSDWYGSYTSGAKSNPTGPATGSYRVFRGGGWDFNARFCRVSLRYYFTPGIRFNFLGFRLCLVP